ncbi:MAG: hypothetical protein RMJ84_03585 [Sandaracinaceae bacterium]|nr:hypothetical protein [Sandaracinaceae bacterium]
MFNVNAVVNQASLDTKRVPQGGGTVFLMCLLCALAWCIHGGCGLIYSAAPEAKFQNKVYAFNDALRWSRFDLALEHCSPVYRAEFIGRRSGWGRTIDVVDFEVLGISMLPNGAESKVVYRWVDRSTQHLHETTLRQRWSSDAPGFWVVGEEIIDGDERLFRPSSSGIIQ